MSTHASLANRQTRYAGAKALPSLLTTNMSVSFHLPSRKDNHTPERATCVPGKTIQVQAQTADFNVKQRQRFLVWTLTLLRPDRFRHRVKKKSAMEIFHGASRQANYLEKSQTAEAMKRSASMARISETFAAIRRCSTRGGTGISMLRITDTLMCFTPVP